MASVPILTVLEQAHVSPPEATVGDRLLPLTYFDLLWLTQPPIHNIFFYDLSITQTQFTETNIPNLKHSLSITLQYFFPFAGNLLVFPTTTKKARNPRYVEGDYVGVTFAECNLDFNKLTTNHPRDCEMFYHLIPPLDHVQNTSDSTKIPLFFVQVTLFPNAGVSIGMTNHHCLGDANTRFNFLKAWTSIAQSGSDESFLASGTMPFYDRLIKNPKREESYLKFAPVETFKEYVPPKLGPTDKVRATFILPRTVLLKLKELVTTKVPTIAYVSCFTVAYAYVWSCIASTRENELQMSGFAIDCRARMNPALPATYFSNCVGGCFVTAQSKLLTGKEGFVTAAKLLGESLHETLTHKDGIMKDLLSDDLFSYEIPPAIIGIAGTPKLKFYDMDFGWGKPRKIETVSIDYSRSVSINACREKDEDLEIGLSLPINEMKLFVRSFEDGLKAYV